MQIPNPEEIWYTQNRKERCMLFFPIPVDDVLVDRIVNEAPVRRVEVSRSYVRLKAEDKGWTDDEWDCLEVIIEKESEWNADAKNPKSTAYGLFQMLKTPKGLPISKQTKRGLKYIKQRYDTPCNALRHHNRRGYY
jgi:hypothetical protein